MNYQKYSIGFKPLEIIKDNGKSNSELSFISDDKGNKKDKAFDKTKKYKSLNYSKTFDENTEINIVPHSSGVKEDIILNKMPDKTEFSYELKVENVVPVLRQDGNLYFIDMEKGINVAAIPIPYMYDSTPESGVTDVAVKLEKTGENTYKYTLLPDKTFLINASYPVVIDPSVATQTGGIYDTYLKSTSSSNYCNDTDIKVGRDSSSNKYRGLLRINQPGLQYIRDVTPNCTITQVKYNAYQNYSGNSTPTVEVHQVTELWAYASVNWSSTPAHGGTIASQVVGDTGWYSWDITSLGVGWYNGSVSSYGILTKISDESQNKYKRFCSDQNGSNKNYFEFVCVDNYGPDIPGNFNLSNSTFNGPTGNMTVSWSAVSDRPYNNIASGLQCYQVAINRNNTGWEYHNTTSTSYTFTNEADNTRYHFAVSAYDWNNNNSGWTYIWDYISPDKTPPGTPGSVTLSPAGWTKDPITVSYSTVGDEGTGVKNYEWSYTGQAGTFYTLSGNTIDANPANGGYIY